MIDFLHNNWKDLLEIAISLIIGFLGGITVTNIRNKNSSKIKGNNNTIIQEGNRYNEQEK